MHKGIACDVKIRQAPKKYPLASVTAKGLVGFISISATDFIGVANKGHAFKTPVISVQINEDVNCQLLSGLRNSFRAIRSQERKPQLRVFLAKQFDATIRTLMEDEGAETGVKQ